MTEGFGVLQGTPAALGQGGGDAGLAAPAPDNGAPDRVRRKKDKVRAAWIAFAGRILAQIIGAIATVALGVYVVRTYGVQDRKPGAIAIAGNSAPIAAAPVPRERLALAVLPFRTFSAVPGQDYVGEGLMDALVTDLARIEDLRVLSRTSSMHYKDSTKTLPIIAGELRADLVVEGSIAREGERVRVSAQLVDAASDTHVWARTYDRTLPDVLGLQADVARTITDELYALLAPRQEQARALRQGVDAETYGLYLRGRYASRRHTAASLQEATTLFTRALERQPRFAMAHAALADTYCVMALGSAEPGEVQALLGRAQAAADAALSRDPENAEAHLALATVRHRRDWDWPAAEREFTRALDLGESHTATHLRYAVFLAEQGRHAEAVRHATRATTLDPGDASAHRTAGLVYLFARQHRDAEAALRRALSIDGTAGATRLLLASALNAQGRCREARAEALRVRDPDLQDQRASLLAQSAALAGDRAEAVRVGDALARRQPAPSLVAVAQIQGALGETSALIATARQALDARADLACALKVHPAFARVRDDPRFRALMDEVGLP